MDKNSTASVIYIYDGSDALLYIYILSVLDPRDQDQDAWQKPSKTLLIKCEKDIYDDKQKLKRRIKWIMHACTEICTQFYHFIFQLDDIRKWDSPNCYLL